ncbi:MAG TPA: DUF6497 family protein [Paracoccaceae bacterium]|nr:DUF6497 family protein [Paracoccaceae bacterium]
MRTGAIIATLSVCLALPLHAEEKIEVPSGQDITFVDMVHDAPGPDGLTYRFRFLAPDIARADGTVTVDMAFDDMQALCEDYALPRVAGTGPAPGQIIISLSDRPVDFGIPNPEATQFFEAFSPEGTTCIWEGF